MQWWRFCLPLLLVSGAYLSYVLVLSREVWFISAFWGLSCKSCYHLFKHSFSGWKNHPVPSKCQRPTENSILSRGDTSCLSFPYCQEDHFPQSCGRGGMVSIQGSGCVSLVNAGTRGSGQLSCRHCRFLLGYLVTIQFPGQQTSFLCGQAPMIAHHCHYVHFSIESELYADWPFSETEQVMLAREQGRGNFMRKVDVHEEVRTGLWMATSFIQQLFGSCLLSFSRVTRPMADLEMGKKYHASSSCLQDVLGVTILIFKKCKWNN